MSFDRFQFHPAVSAGLKHAGYAVPTPIQEQALPHGLAGKDVLGLAQTGTGKTAAFALPILNKLAASPRPKLRALVIAPTRELADQIDQSFKKLGRDARVRSATVYGGVGMGPQVAAFRQGVEVIVACPGRLLDHIRQGTANLSTVEVLVLDEADQMLDMGFWPDIRQILAKVPKQRQTMLFSATMPEGVRSMTRECLKDPVNVSIAHNKPTETVAHALYPVKEHLKNELLLELLRRAGSGSILVFTRTKHRAKRLGKRLADQGWSAASLQGNLSQNQRKQALEGFRSGKHQVLVATDIAARGIDISDITHVVNFDVPVTPEAYTHRIGRTGRAAKTGDAYTLVADHDESLVRAIERLMGRKIERKLVDGFDYYKKHPDQPAQTAGRIQHPRGGRHGHGGGGRGRRR